ncbi:MAG: CAP domain-containing protein, partial [Cytophagales bacterium]|nr:CAP domain-containing protein [Cytophagales bacterium]
MAAVFPRYGFILALLGVCLTPGVQSNDGLRLLNEARSQNGLPPVKEQGQLTRAAKSHSYYMAQNQTLAHHEHPGMKGYSGTGCLERVVRAGYSIRMCSENLSMGESSWKESIENLLSAIYHRFNFLSFDVDEVGSAREMGRHRQTDRKLPYYTYVMSNSLLRRICEAKQSQPSGQYGMCRNQKLVVNTEQYERASQYYFNTGPELVVYPWSGQRQVAPVYVNREIPDPLPGYYVTGQPVSIQFNPRKFRNKKLAVGELVLREAKGRQVSLLPRRDKQTDSINQKFSEYEFAWFPEYPLRWGTQYHA